PLYGFLPKEPIKIKNVGPADKNLFYIVDEEVDLTSIINAPLPPCPVDVTFCAHWLAIEGIQPAIPENPQIIVTSDKNFTKKPQETKTEKDAKAGENAKKPTGVATMAQQMGVPTDAKPTVSHVLSKEQQLYYEKMTEAVIGVEERLRVVALESLRYDPGLQQLLPYFCQFITEKVANNNRNLPLLMATMRMANALVHNTNLFMDPYLHLMLAAILTCCMKKTLSQHPSENHWALRELSASLIAHICARWGDSVITLQTRITKAYSNILEPALSVKNSNPVRRDEALRVQGALLDAVGKFFRNYADHSHPPNALTGAAPKNPPPRVNLSETYMDMLGIFGEALQPYINNYNIEVLHTLATHSDHVRKLKRKRGKKAKDAPDTHNAHEAGDPGHAPPSTNGLANTGAGAPANCNAQASAPVLANTGADAPVLANTGADAPVLANTGADAPVLANTGADAPGLTNTGADAPGLTNTGAGAPSSVPTSAPGLANSGAGAPANGNAQTSAPVLANAGADAPASLPTSAPGLANSGAGAPANANTDAKVSGDGQPPSNVPMQPSANVSSGVVNGGSAMSGGKNNGGSAKSDSASHGAAVVMDTDTAA
ncbi:hypothetical protein SARC_09562, partial [Sphaeroforma arctica JP610]